MRAAVILQDKAEKQEKSGFMLYWIDLGALTSCD
jgi:hypothetical protein